MIQNYLPRYTYGTDSFEKIKEVCSAYGNKAVLLYGEKAYAACRDKLTPALKDLVILHEEVYGKEASYANIDRILKEEVLKGTVSESDIEHFRVLREATAEILGLAIIGFEEKDAKLSGTMQVYREELAAMSGIVKNRFILRTHKEGRSSATPLISKISRSLDRMVDSLDIVADSLIKYSKTLPENIDTAAPYKEDVRKRVRKLFMDKYTILDIGFDEEGRAIDLLQ